MRNLPLNATPQQLEEEFKRFGTIKYEGIQVRSNKVLVFLLKIIFTVISEPNAQIGICISVEEKQIQGFCYGFVEFEDASAVQTAIEVILYCTLVAFLSVVVFFS